jgi:hypothetical protein
VVSRFDDIGIHRRARLFKAWPIIRFDCSKSGMLPMYSLHGRIADCLIWAATPTLYWRGGLMQSVSVVLAVLAALIVGSCDSISLAQGTSAEKTATVKQPAAVRGGPTYGIPEVAYINEMIRHGWADHGLSPSPPATDIEWCRRVYLDILGRIPSVAELDRFLRQRGSNRRLNLVNQLLGEGQSQDAEDQKLNEAYAEEYARNFTTLWTNILIGRNGGIDGRDMISREGMQQYLRRSFLQNKPYNALVMELVAAQGSNRPTGEDDKYNGAVNFLIGKLDDDAVQATAQTAQILLGLQVQCTQCHNHPFNDWKQSQFWQLNAFFQQTKARRGQMTSARGRREGASAQLYNMDFAGQNLDPDPKNAAIFYDLRNGTRAAAWPVFVDGAKINPSGLVSDVDRRAELARLIAASDYMPTAMVNRMWAHFLGYGFTKPVDDMGPHNPPSHPELLARLARDFRKNSFNIKHLIRWIALSEPYSLSSRWTNQNEKDDPSLGEKPRFSRFYVRQMSAEQLYESLIVATEAEKTQTNYEQQERTKADWLRQFTIAFGTDEGGETTTFNGTIPQVLMMFNGDLIDKATSGEPGSFLHKVATRPNLNYQDRVNYLFHSALGRRANAGELRFCEGTLLLAHKGDQLKALQDVFWVLLNSNEFILNH